MPISTLDIARNTALLMVSAMVVAMGAVGLLVQWLGISYPLSSLLLPDNALAVLVAGMGLLGVLLHWLVLQRLAGVALFLHMGYMLLHNWVAGDRLEGGSWVTGDIRMGSLSSFVLILVALCLLLGKERRYQRWFWTAVGTLMVSLGLLAVVRLFLPGGELSWTLPQASSPLLGTTLAVLYGGTMLLTIISGNRAQPHLGKLAIVTGLVGVFLSCSVWYALNWHYQANKQQQARHVLENLQFNAEQALDQQLQLMRRMAERLDAGGTQLDMVMIGRGVENYLRDSPSLQEIGLLNAGVWHWHWSRSAEAGHWIERQLADAEVRAWINERDSTRLLSPDSTRPEMGLITSPVASMGQQLMASVDLARLFEHELRVQLANYRVRMLRSDILILELHALEQTGLQVEYPVLAQLAIELPGGPDLNLEISPYSTPEMLQAALIPGSVALGGLLFSYLLALSLGLTYQRQQSEIRLRVLQRSVEASINGVVITDTARNDYAIIYANEAFQTLTGYSEAELIGRNCRILQGEGTDPERVAALRRELAAERDCHVMLCNYRKDGSQFWNALHVSPVPDAAGRVTHFVGVLNDATEAKAYEARLAHNATHDALTGLANRTLLEERLARYGTTREGARDDVLAVFFIDLDGFKEINDSLGHALGDRVLIEVAQRLRPIKRAVDTLARLGGDEFVMVMPGLNRPEQAALARRLLRIISRPYCPEGYELHLSASIGIATSEIAFERPMELIQRADLAMYRAKKQGRNTYQWFACEITAQVNERLEMRNDLQEAIAQDLLELHYQPLYDRDDTVISVEALLRWKHPVKGYISPGEFIPLAEETGQIMPISQWALERACGDIGALHARGFETLKVAVNLSPLQFHRRGFLDSLRATLARIGFPAEYLELELTEGVLLNDAMDAVAILHELRQMRIDISIDDFGTGFSSLSYLKHLPISKLKIDRSFVSEVTESADDASIVQAIISLAHHLGLAVVAEGIETQQQHLLLKGYGCEVFQGFLLGRPMPLAELEQHLVQKCETR